MSTIFNFPTVSPFIDSFDPPFLLNDITVVNATHVMDLRKSVLELEKALLGPTPFPYNGTHIVMTGDSIQAAIQLLDQNLFAVQQQLGLPDGYTGNVGAPPGTPNMGTSRTYAILGASAVTGSTGAGSTLTGNLGISPGTSITNFPPSTFTGTEDIANGAASTAQSGALSAYTDLSTRPAGTTESVLDGLTLTPGTYTSGSSMSLATSGAGTLTLNGTGVYIFQIGSTLTTGAGGTPTILLTNGAQASDIYWVVGSSATINSGFSGIFQGNVIAQASITVTLGGTVNGTLAALTGAVTLSATTAVNVQVLGSQIPSRLDTLQSEFEAHRDAAGPIDAAGYGVHDVDGQIVGTENPQDLINKRIDSGLTQVGPKFVARATIADYSDGYLGQQIQVFGVDGNLNAWIDELGDAYFLGDLIVEGDRILKGMDLVEQSLTVDGYSILGNDPTLDYVTAYGSFTLYGTSGHVLQITNSGDISGDGANVTLGNNTGNLTLNFVQANIDANTTISNSLASTGPVLLGNPSGSTTTTIKGSILHSLGDITSAAPNVSLGNSTGALNLNFTQATVTGNQLSVSSSIVSLSPNNDYVAFSANTSRTILSDGYNYTFGLSSAAGTNTFIVYATTQIQGQLTVTDLFSGPITAGATTLSGLTVNGALKINNGDQQDGYVWTAIGGLGTGTWAAPRNISWHSVVTDGYSATDANGTALLSPTGFYAAMPSDEIFASTANGTFTINLPSAPFIGNRIRVIDQNGNWSNTNEVFVFPDMVSIIKTWSSTDVNTGTNTIHIPSHGLITGERGQLSGALPSGLNTISPFYIITSGANDIKFASSLANALAGTPVALVTQGSGTQTFMTGTIMGSAFLELNAAEGWVEIVYNGTEWRVLS